MKGVLKLWSAAVSEMKSVAEIVSDTVQMKNAPAYVCAKTSYVG
jgi:hypothetical protein